MKLETKYLFLVFLKLVVPLSLSLSVVNCINTNCNISHPLSNLCKRLAYSLFLYLEFSVFMYELFLGV